MRRCIAVLAAVATAAWSQSPALVSQFQQVRDAVVTVWSDFGSGTGFIVLDNAGQGAAPSPAPGLILTNDHVIAGARWVAVQFDPQRKVRATVLAEDAVRDVAVLGADLAAFPGAHPAALAAPEELAALQPGEEVFTVGSPLNLRKVLTAGVLSGIEPRALLSDINLNHGNSGGPLFDGRGHVIGITTFLDAGEPDGPGMAGMIKISEADPALAAARRALLSGADPPSAALLPVAPAGAFPVTALQAVMRLPAFDLRPYQFKLGGFQVTISTPVVAAWLQSHHARAVAGARSRRTGAAAEPGFDPASDLREWMRYTGEFAPLVSIVATPRFQATLLSRLGRALDRRRTGLRYRYAADFDHMELLCGERAVAPITPGRIPEAASFATATAHGVDAVYAGIYQYGPAAITPACGAMRLAVYSSDGQVRSTILDPALVQRVWQSFAPWRSTLPLAGTNLQ